MEGFTTMTMLEVIGLVRLFLINSPLPEMTYHISRDREGRVRRVELGGMVS